MTTLRKLIVTPGDQLHFLKSGFTFSASLDNHSGQVSERGQVVTITQSLIDASRDRYGSSWLERLEDLENEFFAIGPWPENEPVFLAGSVEHAWEAERQRTIAHAIVDEFQRGAELARIRKEFGIPRSHQSSTDFAGLNGGL